MKLTNEQKDMLTRLGKAFFNHRQCSIQLQIPYADFRAEMKNADSDCYIAYNKGFLEMLLDLRESEAQSALRGSNPALQSMVRAAQDTMTDNML